MRKGQEKGKQTWKGGGKKANTGEDNTEAKEEIKASSWKEDGEITKEGEAQTGKAEEADGNVGEELAQTASKEKTSKDSNFGTHKEAKARKSRREGEEEHAASGRRPGSSTDAPENIAAEANQEEGGKKAKKQRKDNESEAQKREGKEQRKQPKRPKRKRGEPGNEQSRHEESQRKRKEKRKSKTDSR